MRKRQKFFLLFVLPLVLLLTLGRAAPSHAQQCDAAGDACVNGIAAAIAAAYNSILSPALKDATAEVMAYFTPLTNNFDDGMHPVLNWTAYKIGSWFDTFWFYNLRPMMQAMTRELNVANAEQTNAIGSFEDAANFIRMARLTGNATSDNPDPDNHNPPQEGGDFGIADHRALRPSANVCTAGTIASGIVRANVFSDAFNTAAAAGKLWRSANLVGYPSSEGAGKDLNHRWQHKNADGNPEGYVAFWCDERFNNGHSGCGAAGTGPFAGQDVDVGQIFAQDTLPLTDNMDDAAACHDPIHPDYGGCNSQAKRNLDELIVNLAEPFAKDPITAYARDANEPLLRSVAYKTKRQIVYDNLYYVAARRVPAGMPSALLGALQDLRAQTGDDVPGMTPNASRNEVLRALMTQRYRNGKYALTQIDEPENNRRELVIQQALQLMQMSDELDLMDHYSLLLAAQVSREVIRNTAFSDAGHGAPLTHP
jgi:hypothetical protein